MNTPMPVLPPINDSKLHGIRNSPAPITGSASATPINTPAASP